MPADFALDIYNEQRHVDLKKLREAIGADQIEFATIAEMAVATVKANRGSVGTDKKVKNLVYALKLLAPLCKNDPNRIRAWFTDPKVFWGGLTPLEMFSMKKSKGVIETLESYTDGEAAVGS